MKKLLVTAVAAASLASSMAFASESPVMFSSVNHFNAPHQSAVKGVRLSALHGKVNSVTGLDISLLGMSETNNTVGVNWGIFGGNKVNQSMTGASFGIFNYNKGLTKGVNVGAVNLTHNVNGVNLSFVNFSKGQTLVDLGAVSLSNQSEVQVGIFNHTHNIKGVQVGLINCADNGFLKCFPIVNFAL
ncbi:VC2662 family protein [Vibrio gallicus]|uniref:VC2662 family protein n=1 Tax=Vibrio gallicus TaxID=190897 RepID=UPI0021C3AA0C|nr:phaC PHA synthase [Vibrio gallicus]